MANEISIYDLEDSQLSFGQQIVSFKLSMEPPKIRGLKFLPYSPKGRATPTCMFDVISSD